MIEYSTGSIFDCSVQALVNPVNLCGVAGAGLALEFKKRFPISFAVYRDECRRGGIFWGRVLFTQESSRYIVCFPTKYHWSSKSVLEKISVGLDDMVKGVLFRDIQSIAIPALGCGLGGLDWADVKPLIESAAEKMPDVRVIAFPPKEVNS